MLHVASFFGYNLLILLLAYMSTCLHISFVSSSSKCCHAVVFTWYDTCFV